MTIPAWRRRLRERSPMAEWWRQRHHCSDVVLGENRVQNVAQMRYTDTQDYEDYSTDIRPLILAKRQRRHR